MDRAALLSRALSAEERTLFARVLDKYDQCRRRSVPTATPFLSPAEQQGADRLLRAAGIVSGFCWNGGYDAAERKLLQFLPDWAEEDDTALACLRGAFRGDAVPDHRDCLGSLMALGVTRERIGDILLLPDACEVVVSPDILPFLLQSWTSAGRVRLTEIGRAHV